MRSTLLATAATVLVALLVLAPTAHAGDLLTSAVLTKQGVSGQVYAWQTGSC